MKLCEHTCWASMMMMMIVSVWDLKNIYASDVNIHCIAQTVKKPVKLDTTTMDIRCRHSAK